MLRMLRASRGRGTPKTLGKMKTESQRVEAPKTRLWPWIVLIILNVITIAPSGIFKIFDVANDFNKNTGYFITAYCIIFITLFIIGLRSAAKRARSTALMITLGLFILNLSGCAAIWAELATIN